MRKSVATPCGENTPPDRDRTPSREKCRKNRLLPHLFRKRSGRGGEECPRYEKLWGRVWGNNAPHTKKGLRFYSKSLNFFGVPKGINF